MTRRRLGAAPLRTRVLGIQQADPPPKSSCGPPGRNTDHPRLSGGGPRHPRRGPGPSRVKTRPWVHRTVGWTGGSKTIRIWHLGIPNHTLHRSSRLVAGSRAVDPNRAHRPRRYVPRRGFGPSFVDSAPLEAARPRRLSIQLFQIHVHIRVF